MTEVLDALEKELKDLNLTKKDVQKSLVALKKSRNKPHKKKNARAGGRAHGMEDDIPAEHGHNPLDILGMMFGIMDHAPGRQRQREQQRIEEARRRQALEEERSAERHPE